MVELREMFRPKVAQNRITDNQQFPPPGFPS